MKYGEKALFRSLKNKVHVCKSKKEVDILSLIELGSLNDTVMESYGSQKTIDRVQILQNLDIRLILD